MHDTITYNGKLFQIIHRKQTKEILFNDFRKEVTLEYELVKRPPGVRAIIDKNNQILLNKEFRYELNAWDYRLPGGKVFDSLEEQNNKLISNSIMQCVESKLKEELYEEADILAKNCTLLEISHCGFTVEWDLFYYIVDDFDETPAFFENNIQKNSFEYIQHCWVDYHTAYKYCIEKKVSEERSSNVLLRYLLSKLPLGDGLHR